MEQITITATKRTILGKLTSRLRKKGTLPAVIYGHNLASSQSIEINEREFQKAFKQAGESTIVNVSLDGKNHPVLIQDVQNHFLKDTPIHVDFFAVNMTEKLTANVPLVLVGEAPAVKTLGGVLVKNLSEVEVECFPADLPQHIEVDISQISNFETDIRVSNLNLGDKVKILTNPEEVIVTVAAPRSEAELASLSEKPVEADVNAVEGVTKPEEPAVEEPKKE